MDLYTRSNVKVVIYPNQANQQEVVDYNKKRLEDLSIVSFEILGGILDKQKKIRIKF